MLLSDLDLDILYLIWGRPMTIYSMCKQLNAPDNLIRHHIKKMLKGDIILPDKQKNKTLYSVNKEKALVNNPENTIMVINGKKINIYAEQKSKVFKFLTKSVRQKN